MSKLNIKDQLSEIVHVNGGELYGAGSWKNGKILFEEGSREVTAPKRLLEKHLPSGGTILEILAGNCDYMYEISKLNVWEMHAMDRNIEMFHTVPRSSAANINLYRMNIESLIEYDFQEKIDVFICHDAWGAGLPHDLEKQIEQWIWKNFKYMIIHMKQVINIYKRKQMAFDPVSNQAEAPALYNKKHNAQCIAGFSGKDFIKTMNGTLPKGSIEDEWTLFKLIK